MYNKCDDFDFEIVSFPVLNGDVPRSASCGICVSQLIKFARASTVLLTSFFAVDYSETS